MFNLALRISPVNGLGVGCRSRPLFGGLGASDFGKLCSLGIRESGQNLGQLWIGIEICDCGASEARCLFCVALHYCKVP